MIQHPVTGLIAGVPARPSLPRRERVARAIAEAAGDDVFDRNEPDCTSDIEDRAYWRRLGDAAIEAIEKGSSTTGSAS